MKIIEEIQKDFLAYWHSFLDSLPKLSVAIATFVIFYVIASAVKNIYKKRFLKYADNQLIANYVIKLVKIFLILVGLMFSLEVLGLTNVASGLLAGAGMGAVIFGFAFKEIGQNFLAGIILIFDRPFHMGDTVTIEGNMGVVKGLSIRTTHLKTFDGKDVYVPNSFVITNEVCNHTKDGYLRLDFMIGIAYEDDIDTARDLIRKTVNANPHILKSERTLVLVNDFATNTINMQIMFWVQTMDYKVSSLEIKTQVMKSVKNVLVANGFGLPANIQEIKMYGSEPIPITIKEHGRNYADEEGNN